MNSVLWLVYLSGVSENLAAFLMCSGLLGIMFTFFCLLSGRIENQIKEVLKFKWVPAVSVALMLASGFMPTKEFFYLAAGLQSTKIAAKSELGQKVLRIAEQELDKALEQDK